MAIKETVKELLTLLIAAVILGLAVAYPNLNTLLYITLSFIIIIFANFIVKKIFAYSLEAEVKPKFWSWYRFGFRADSHFKHPVPMIWLPLALSFLTKGLFWWLMILEFDVNARVERVSRRHGLYRFTEMTDWHIALIAVSGIVINLALAIVGYLIGFETFSRLNIYFAFWSLIPLAGWDGSKILFGSRPLWFTMLVIVSVFLGWSLIIV